MGETDRVESVASAIAIEDGYDPNGVDPGVWDAWKHHYRKMARAALAVVDGENLTGEGQGEPGLARSETAGCLGRRSIGYVTHRLPTSSSVASGLTAEALARAMYEAELERVHWDGLSKVLQQRLVARAARALASVGDLAVVDGEGSASRAAFELRQAFDRLDAETVNEQQEARAAQVAWRHVQRAYDELRAASPGSSGGEQLTALELMAADYLESEGKVGVDVSPTVETYLARARRLAGGVEAEPEESGEPRWRCPRHGLVVSSEVAYESHSQIPYHAKGSCGTDVEPVAEPEVE